MKHLTIAILFLLAVNISAQSNIDSVRTTGYIPVYKIDDTKWITRHQSDMDKFEAENKKDGTACDALFIGSSTFTLWKTIHKDMAPLKVINRGFGGSTIRDILYNYNTVARGYNTKKIVLYVENDLSNDKDHIITAGDAYDLFRVFAQMIKRDYPESTLYIVSLKPSPSRVNDLKEQQTLNHLLKNYAATQSNVEYIDITEAMYKSNGKLRNDIFLKDDLHMNEKGYDIWTEIIKPILSK